MIPLRLTLSGFMSYRDEQTLNFEDDSLWVLVGKNASGKSSIFDAIIFALFGETRGSGIQNSALVNHNSDSAQITFDFAVGNKKYRVRRTIDKKSRTTRQAYMLLLKPDGLFMPQPIPLTHREKEFRDWIEKDIGLNFEVFTTSVLLRQGKADAFLNAETEVRYEVLSKLIDLSKYVDLEVKAREQKKHWEKEAAFHRGNLNRMSKVTEQDLIDLQIAIDRENETADGSRRLVDQLQTLFGQASQWEPLNTGLLEARGKNKTHRSLLSRTAEINDRFVRLTDLGRTLPKLKMILDLTQAIGHADKVVGKLLNEWKTDDDLIQTHESTVKKLDAEQKQKVGRVDEVATQSNELYRRLDELSPVINLIVQVKQFEEKLASYHAALTQFPDNLDEILQSGEVELNSLVESEYAIGGLSRLVDERTRLIDIEQQRLQLFQQLQDKKDARPSVLKAKKDAEQNFEKAEVHERNMRDALTQVNTLLDAVREHMDNFKQVARVAKCQYCGSELTKEHKAQERKRLTSELEEKSLLVDKAQNEQRRAEEALRQTKVLQGSTDDGLKQLDADIKSITSDTNRVEREIQERIVAIGTTYDSLSVAYQEKISPSKPASVMAWAETIYPTKSDLKSLSDAVRLISRRRADVAKLADRVSKRNEIQILSKSTSDTRKITNQSLPSNWKELQTEHQRLSGNKSKILQRVEIAKRDAEEATDALEQANRKLRELHDRQNRRMGTLETSKIELQRKRDELTAKVGQLPESWQTQAAAITEEQFNLLSDEMNTLQEYDGLYKQLALSNQALNNLQQQEIDLQEKIKSLPVKARRPAEVVGKELTDAREANRLAEGRSNQAEAKRAQLLVQYDQYEETEECWKMADRKAYLYGILTDHFGEKGIQKVIINKAEVAIVRLSNQLLDNLSGGRSRLRLREVGGNKKALDLEVWDSQTGGDKPVLAGLASGSQRFRIAISLALGIGQYVSNESNRIESVIIDEGFGSLDREGRESIIQELYNLSRHLKRIILVSHQEEFSQGFSTGYEVHLVDGASRIKPLVR